MKKIVFIIFTASILLACDGPKGEKGKILETRNKTGTIIGFVELYNNSNFKEVDLSGVKIELRNSDTTYISTSDIRGKYTIENLPIGGYNLTFKKDGYPTYKLFGFNNFGDTCYPIKKSIYAKTTTIVNKNVVVDTETSQDYIEIKGTFQPVGSESKSKNVIAFISKDKNVSPTNYEHSKSTSSHSDTGYNNFSFYVSKTKYKPGTSIYLTAYGMTNFNEYYYNKDKDIKIYPSISDSNTGIIEVKIP